MTPIPRMMRFVSFCITPQAVGEPFHGTLPRRHHRRFFAVQRSTGRPVPSLHSDCFNAVMEKQKKLHRGIDAAGHNPPAIVYRTTSLVSWSSENSLSPPLALNKHAVGHPYVLRKTVLGIESHDILNDLKQNILLGSLKKHHVSPTGVMPSNFVSLRSFRYFF